MRKSSMQVTAQLNYLRIAPRKVRLAAKFLRGMPVEKAEHQLSFVVKRSSGPLSKLLKSAVSNAENNFGLIKENLFIKELLVNEGVKIKRFMPRAMGQAGLIQKKSSHIKIVLEEKVPGLKARKPEPVVKEMKVEPEEEKFHDKTKKPVVESRKPLVKKEVFGGVRKFFRRKSI